MKDLFKSICSSFFMITTGSLLAATIFTSIFNDDIVLNASILWQILIISFLTSSLSIIFYSKYELSKKTMIVRRIIHYILLNLLIILCAHKFQWINIKNIFHVLVFILMIFIIYVSVSLTCFTREVDEARKLNKKIQEYRKNK